MNLLAARATGTPRADLSSVDLAWTHGPLDVAGEVAARHGGGTAAYARADVTPSDKWGIGVEARRYENFASPLGSAPLYGGLTAGDERDEIGGLVRADFAPTRRFSGSVSWDWSRGPDKSGAGAGAGAGGTLLRRDARLALRWSLGERTSLAYGFEHEDLSKGRDGRVHSLLAATTFEKAGRLAVRLSLDEAAEDPRKTIRVSYRLPLRQRKVTLLVDDTLRLDDVSNNRLQAGASVRLGKLSFLTVRGTLAQGEADTVDVTWYRRF
jgi:hypothetical protein